MERNKRIFALIMVSVAFAFFAGILVRFSLPVKAAELPQQEIASGSDAYSQPDLSNYMSIEVATEYFSDTYIMLVSIRNVLILILIFLFCAWSHYTLKSIIYKLTRK